MNRLHSQSIRLNLALVLCLLTSTVGMSQAYTQGQVWLNTDTIPSENSLLGRQALLLVEVDTYTHDLGAGAEEAKILQKEYPWLNVVLRYSAIDTRDRSINQIANKCMSAGWQSVILIDTIPPMISERSEAKLNAVFQLYSPDKTLRMQTRDLSAISQSNMVAELDKIGIEFKGPGKALSSSFLYQAGTSLIDMRLLKSPHSLAIDPIYSRLIISDTGHDRVILTDLEGRLYETIGPSEGTTLGPFDETALNHPMGLAFHGDSSLLFIADYGNERIVVAETNRRTTEELNVTDLEGLTLDWPSSPMDLHLDGELLTISMPQSGTVWTVDIFSRILQTEIKGKGDSPRLHKKLKKTTLGYPKSTLTHQGEHYILDSDLPAVFNVYDERTRLLATTDERTARSFRNDVRDADGYTGRIRYRDGDIYVIGGLSAAPTRIDINTRAVSPFAGMQDSLDYTHITDIAWHDDLTFYLDGGNGNIIIDDRKNELSSYLRFSDAQRMSHGVFSVNHFSMAEPITVSSSQQTELTIELDFGEEYILHPNHTSALFKSAGSELYVESENPALGTLDYIVLPDFTKNQINILGEVYLMRIGYPHEVYRRMVQISIPVIVNDIAAEKQSVAWPLSSGMPLGD